MGKKENEIDFAYTATTIIWIYQKWAFFSKTIKKKESKRDQNC